MFRFSLLWETDAEVGVQVEWRVERFMFLFKEQSYDVLHSPAFSISDSEWFLQLFMIHKEDGWVCMWLCKRFSTTKKHAVKYMLGIRRRDGSVYMSFGREQKFQKFGGHEWGRLVSVSDLNQWANLLTDDNGGLMVFGTIILAKTTVLDDVQVVEIPRELPSQASIPKTVASYIVWKVEDFTSLPKGQDNFSLKSPTFPLAGETWCMEVYPNGKHYDPGWVSLYLNRVLSSSEKRTVAFTLGIQTQVGTPERLYHYEREYFTNTGLGMHRFIRSSELLDPKNGLVFKGSVTFFCTVRPFPCPLATTALTERGTQTLSDPSHAERASRTPPSERYKLSQSTSAAL